MRFSIENGIRIVEVPVKDLRVILYDGPKKAMGPNRCNAGFFGGYKEQGDFFTLPVGHLIADYEASSKWTRHYCQERGAIKGGKVRHNVNAYPNSFKGKRLSTLVVSGSRANILDLLTIPDAYDYAISGIPVMRGGKPVEYATAVAQGWEASSLYGTMHIFVGIKAETAASVYVMAMKTTTGNLLSTKEAARKFKTFGMRDVIKLDGGGSFYFNAAGNTLATMENRRVCTILDFGTSEGNPYAVPTKVLWQWIGDKTGVCWLQWELTAHGFPCEVDGSFGPATLRQLKAYQKANGLEVDGRCGPATRASLLKK